MTAPLDANLVLRTTLLGLATGGRNAAGLTALVVAGRGTPGLLPPGRALLVAAAAGYVGETVGDKMPWTPSRLKPPLLAVRMTTGALVGVELARRARQPVWAAGLVGFAAAAVGSYAGAAWRRQSAKSRPDWQGALIEDAAVLALAAAATRPA